MLILAIDTSTQAGSVAVLRDTSIWGVVSTCVEETYSSRMFRQLDFLLRELEIEQQHFDLYAVATGPGSFTGLRVGLTAVKGWAEVYQRPVAPVSSLEAIAAQAHARGRLLVPVLDARRGQVFGGIYERTDRGLRVRGDEVVMSPEEFLEYVGAELRGQEFAFVTPTPEVLAHEVAASPLSPRPVEVVSTVLAPVIGLLGGLKALRGEVVDALHLDANYVRRSDAELMWKG